MIWPSAMFPAIVLLGHEASPPLMKWKSTTHLNHLVDAALVSSA